MSAPLPTALLLLRMKISVRAAEESAEKNANRNGVKGHVSHTICGMCTHTVSFTRLTLLYTITLKAVLITLQSKFKYFSDMQSENSQEFLQSILFFHIHRMLSVILQILQTFNSRSDFTSTPEYSQQNRFPAQSQMHQVPIIPSKSTYTAKSGWFPHSTKLCHSKWFPHNVKLSVREILHILWRSVTQSQSSPCTVQLSPKVCPHVQCSSVT